MLGIEAVIEYLPWEVSSPGGDGLTALTESAQVMVKLRMRYREGAG